MNDVLSTLSSLNTVYFGSNIQVSSITSIIYFNGGQVGIGTSSLQSSFNVGGTSLFRGIANFSTSVTIGSTLNVTSRIGINCNVPSHALSVNGSTFINGQLTVSTGGSALYVNGSTFINGQLGISTAGSAAIPSLYFTELGNDTGFFTPGDGAIGITTNGGERFRFAAAQLIGCNSEIVLNGLNQGTLSLFPNTIEPQIELKTTSAVGNPNISWSNSAVNYKTFLAGPTSGSIAANNQLMTYTYPGTNLAIAVHSTGNVAIKAVANGSDALYVNGSTFINGRLGIDPAGSAAAPAIYFTETSSDTGIFHPGDGILAFTTDGSERYRVNSSGIRGSTNITFYGSSNGQVSLDPTNLPNLTLTSGCNDNGNAVRIQMNMPSTAFRTFVGGGTGTVGVDYRQLQTFAVDLTTGGTSNKAISIHSTGNVAIRAAANGSNALFVNGSTFINGPMGIQSFDSNFALTVGGGIRQTEPYIWSYSHVTNLIGVVNYPTILNEPYAGLYSVGFFTIPFGGLYTVNVAAMVTCGVTTRGDVQLWQSNTTACNLLWTGWSATSAAAQATQVCYSFTSTFTNTNSTRIYVVYNNAISVNTFEYGLLSVQYLG